MRSRVFSFPKVRLLVIITVLLASLPAFRPAHAATAAIGQFWASCGQFSVDVAVSGVNNDGNNLDKFRYLITDGNGKVLYQEDATRQISTTASSFVVNMSYTLGTPDKNPVKIAVIDLDGGGNAGGEVGGATYQASCLAASGVASRSGTFFPPRNVGGNITTTTHIWQGPNTGQMDLIVGAGSSWNVIYRTADNQWVAIFVASSNLVWVPASTIQTNLGALTTLPTRIDGSTLSSSPGSGPAAPASGGVTALVLVDSLNLRAGPGDPKVLAALPYKTTVAVLGRSRSGGWLKVSFNSTVGWISSRYIRLSGGTLSGLPIVS